MADASTRKEKTVKAKAPPGAEARFSGLMRGLLTVSKTELETRETEWKAKRARKKR